MSILGTKWYGHILLMSQSISQSIGMYRMRWFLAVLRSLFHSSLSYTFSYHSSPPTILPSSLTSYSHLFLCLPLGLVVSRFIYNTFLGILFSSILCTCPNQRNLCSLIVFVIVGFLIFAWVFKPKCVCVCIFDRKLSNSKRETINPFLKYKRAFFNYEKQHWKTWWYYSTFKGYIINIQYVNILLEAVPSYFKVH